MKKQNLLVYEKKRSIIKTIIYLYFIYFFSSIILFIKVPISPKFNKEYNVEEMKTKNNQDNYAKIIETPTEALDVRLSIIEQAKETIDLIYFKFKNGEAGDLIIAGLLKKADEGVKIRIMVDGLNPDTSTNFMLLSNHPNVSYYYFEKFSFIAPYNVNNSLHDKMMMVDNNYGIIGGRNINDRFLIDGHENLTKDRDVLVYSSNSDTNAVVEMTEYFDDLLNSKYVKEFKLSKPKNAFKVKEDLISYHNSYDFNNLEHNLKDSIKVDNVSFVRSPLNRLNKKTVFYDILDELIDEVDNVTIQSPYFTQSKRFNKYYNNENNKKITYITNNIATNPNFSALTGYVTIRNKMANNGTLYEIQDDYSNHAKSLTIGDNLSMIGSFNFDNRSLRLSTESGFIIYSKEFNEALTSKFDDLINKSLIVDKKGNYIKNDNIVMTKARPFKKYLVNVTSLVSRLISELM